MSTRGTNFLYHWLAGNVPDGVGDVSVAELTRKLFEDARAIGIGQGELEEDTGSAYEAIMEWAMKRDGGLAD